MSDWWGYEGGGYCPTPYYPNVVPGQGPHLANVDISLALVTPSDTGISTPLTSAVGGRVQRAGDTMSGRLLLGAGNPVSSLEAVCKQYVDALATAGALAVAAGSPVTLESTLTQTVTTVGVGAGLANPFAFGILRPTLNLSGANDQLLNYNVIEATLNVTGALNSVGGVTTNNLNVGSYQGNALFALVGYTPPSQYSANTSSVNKGPGGLMALYLATQGVTLANDGIYAYGVGNAGAQSWAQYMATTLLDNTATNPYEGPSLQWEYDFWASGVDSGNGRYLGGQINGHQKYGQGQWTYNTSAAQTVAGPTLQFAPGSGNPVVSSVPQATLGRTVSGTGIAAGTVVLSANATTGVVTLSRATTAAVASNTAIVIGGSYLTTWAFGITFELDVACRVGSFLLTNQYVCAGVDTRGSFIPQAQLLANVAAGGTTLRVSDVGPFVYANYFGDGVHTYAPPSPGNVLRTVIQDGNGTRQTVGVIGYALDGPGLSTGTLTLAAPGLVTAITDATTADVLVTPNSAALWLKDGQCINFDFAGAYQIGVDTTNNWLAFNGLCTFNESLYIPANSGAGRLYLNRTATTANYLRYNPFTASVEIVQTYQGTDTALFGVYDQGGSAGVSYFAAGVKMANLPVQPLGLAAGSLYRSSSAPNATVMVV